MLLQIYKSDIIIKNIMAKIYVANQIEINPIPKVKTVSAKQGSVSEDTRNVSETSRAFNKTIMEG